MSSSQGEPVSPPKQHDAVTVMKNSEGKCGGCGGDHPSGNCTNERSIGRFVTSRSWEFRHGGCNILVTGGNTIIHVNPNGVWRGGRRRNNRRNRETLEEKIARLERQLEAVRKEIVEKEIEKEEKKKREDGDASKEASSH